MLQSVRDILWIVLLPLSWVYGALVHFLIGKKQASQLGVPVISVGNLHSGGTGKTPLVIQLSHEFKSFRPAVVSRGYRGKLSTKGGFCDPSSEDGPKLFGDEPWMISQQGDAAVYVGARRLKVIKDFSVDKKHRLIILDDGFQHRQVFRNVDIVVIPAEADPWEANCLPLGELREPLRAIKRASCVVITFSLNQKRKTELWCELVKSLAPQIPIFTAERIFNWKSLSGSPWGAFCGIAHPERFRMDLEAIGKLQFFRAFPDHHSYKEKDIQTIILEAKKKNLKELVTTEKDYDKVFKWFQASAFPLSVARVKYQIPRDFVDFIESRVA